ncbi:MAG: conjugal transfer protein TraG, partial [Burkholderiaceae bacterium]|nr:conjugal transfer protein TraG [Burkholderiaceae bacterium]
ISGNTFSSNMLTGRTAVSLLRNQGYASRVVSMRVSEQDVQDASRQVDAARSEAVAASTERSAVLSEAFTKGLAKLKSSRSSTGSTSSSFEQLGQTIDRLDQISRSVSESTGLTQSQVARIALGVTGHAGFNARFVGAQLNASADKTYLSGLSADERKVLGALTSEQASEFKQFGDRVSRDSSVASLVATDAREARELSSRIATTTARSARADASLADRAAFSERLAVARERGDSISIDIAQDPYNLAMFTRYAEQYGGTSASAQQLLSAELARQALAPTRNFSDGTGMPSSFDDVRHLYTTNSGDPRTTPDIDATYRRATGAVRQAPLPVAPPAQPAPEPSDARQQIQTSSDDLRGRTAARRHEFDDERSPRRADDGTISPRQSLFKGTARQVARDAAETFQDAKDAVKGIIKR